MVTSDQEVPDLSGVTGYTMDDVVYNQAGMQSPAQQRQGYKRIVAAFASGAFGVAFALFWLFHGVVPFAVALLVLLGFGAFKTMREFEDVSAGAVSHVDGDIRTELVQDSESPDTYLLHIAGMKLAITHDAYKVLRDGGPYRIYCIKDRAVGGEVLPGWRPAPLQEKKKKTSWWRAFPAEAKSLIARK